MLGNLNGKPMKSWLVTRTTIRSMCNERFRAALSPLTVVAQSSGQDE